jgi:hypothetical protein
MLQEVITKIKGSNQCFILQLTDDYYIQGASNENSDTILLEAVSNSHLPKQAKLSDSKIDDLIVMGWVLDHKYSDNFTFEKSIQNPNDIDYLSEWIIKTATHIYQVESIEKSMVQFI